MAFSGSKLARLEVQVRVIAEKSDVRTRARVRKMELPTRDRRCTLLLHLALLRSRRRLGTTVKLN